MVVPTIYNFSVIVDASDGAVSRSIATTGTWEPYDIRTMARFVKKGMTILNMGSHIGLEAMVLGKIVGETGKLFIFEPDTITNNIVSKNVYLNKL
jgi:tRNA A58 N-methylase Trm61